LQSGKVEWGPEGAGERFLVPGGLHQPGRLWMGLKEYFFAEPAAEIMTPLKMW
jgi:hypothetical protein